MKLEVGKEYLTQGAVLKVITIIGHIKLKSNGSIAYKGSDQRWYLDNGQGMGLNQRKLREKEQITLWI